MTVQKRLDFFGNWKMAQTLSSCADFFNHWELATDARRRIALFPSFTHLAACGELIRRRNLKISMGGQDCSTESKGAFTGEISATQLSELSCEFVLVGHSERRQRAKETPETLRKRLDQAFEAKLTPVYCIGETEAERDAGKVNDVLSKQLEIVAFEKRGFLLAYEPVWAIGTGRSASSKDIDEAHSFIWNKVPSSQSVLYGGSVKPENAEEILNIGSVTGLLVGGASLKVTDFSKIVDAGSRV